MFELENGRKHFYQWDIGQRLIINDNTVVEAHFCNRTDECSLVCEAYTDGGKRVVDVPNILLQTDWDIRVYAYCGNYTKIEKRFDVVKRSKPADYVYTETETKSYNTLENRIEVLEKQRIENGVNTVNGKAGDVVLTAADVGALPQETVIPVVPSQVSAFANDAGYLTQSNLSGYYTKTETETAIETAIDAIPATDLSNYYTKAQTNAQINAAKPNLTPYAKKTELNGLASESYVDDAIAAIPPTDLSNYYTKMETNNQIQNAKPDLTPYAKTTDFENYYTIDETDSEIDRLITANNGNYYTKTQTNSAISTALKGYAKETYVNTKVAELVGTAPETLDTLGEIATALETNSEVVATLNQAIGTKANKTELNGLASETYVNNAIAAIPPTDLSNYYTKTQTNTQITTALSPYAKKTELPSTAGLASETYVKNAIAAIPPTDLTNYYTKAQTNTAINNAKPDLTPYATKANSESWTFTLKDGTTLTKKVVLS